MIPGLLAFLAGAVRALLRRPLPGGNAAGPVGGSAAPSGDPPADPRERRVPHDPRAEAAVAVLLVLGGVLALAFAVLVAAYPQTQVLGATLAGSLACIGAALAIASRRLVGRMSRA